MLKVRMTLPIGKMIQPSNPREGFTLIEILLVMIVLSVLLGLTAVNYPKMFSSMEFQQSVDDLVSTMRYAQSKALTDGVRYQLAFKDNFTVYQLLRCPPLLENGKDGAGEPCQPFKSRMGRRFSIGKRLRLESSREEWFFHPNGTMDRGKIYLYTDKRKVTLSTEFQRGEVLVLPDES